MITKLDLVVGLTVETDEVLFKKAFTTDSIDNTLSPYQCFSNKQQVIIGDKTYVVDYSFIVKEVDK